jgi:hypothetical protein
MIGGNYIVFTDITANFKHPCVIDIKLGKRTYVSHASEEKKRKELTKYPWQEESGFRFVGSRTYDAKEGKFQSLNKKSLYKVTPDKFLDVFRNYYSSGIVNKSARQRAVQSTLSQLIGLIDCFKQQQHFDFISSSLLVAYDAGGGAIGSIDTQEVSVDMKFIDITHVSGGVAGEVDESTLFGLERVAHTLSLLLDDL